MQVQLQRDPPSAPPPPSPPPPPPPCPRPPSPPDLPQIHLGIHTEDAPYHASSAGHSVVEKFGIEITFGCLLGVAGAALLALYMAQRPSVYSPVKKSEDAFEMDGMLYGERFVGATARVLMTI